MSETPHLLDDAQSLSDAATAEFRRWRDTVRAANDRGEAPDTSEESARIAALTEALAQRASATEAAAGQAAEIDPARHFRIRIGETTLTLTPTLAILTTPFLLVDAPLTRFAGEVAIDRRLHVADDVLVDRHLIVAQNVVAAECVLDGAGNTNHHGHAIDDVYPGEASRETEPPPPLLTPPTGEIDE
jgi:hypothetical protein